MKSATVSLLVALILLSSTVHSFPTSTINNPDKIHPLLSIFVLTGSIVVFVAIFSKVLSIIFTCILIICGPCNPLIPRYIFTGYCMTLIVNAGGGLNQINLLCFLLLLKSMWTDFCEMIEYNETKEAVIKRSSVFAKACIYAGGLFGELFGITGVYGSIIGGLGGEAVLKIVQGCSWIASRFH
ncbi:unnamed protein product [Caenorhabditis brenneri]